MNTQVIAVEIETEEVAQTAEVQSLSDLDLELVGGGAVIVSLD
jgi:hypothetical protein